MTALRLPSLLQSSPFNLWISHRFPSSKRDEAPPKLPPRFLRPLFPFLFPHEKILNQIGASLNVRDAGGSEQQQLGVAEEMKAVKDKGHVLVKAGKHA